MKNKLKLDPKLCEPDTDLIMFNMIACGLDHWDDKNGLDEFMCTNCHKVAQELYVKFKEICEKKGFID